jgi:triphosphatase
MRADPPADKPRRARDGVAPPDAQTGEIEWQFDAPDLRPVERWLASLPTRAYYDVPSLTVLAKPTRRLVDRYMDTADWRLAQAGFVLRTRQRGHAVEVTMKDTGTADREGLRRRLELTESLPSGLGALGSSGPVGRRVRAVAGRRPLVQVLEIRTRRQPFSLRVDGSEVAEVALDDTTIVVGMGKAPARLRRVEVEVAPGWLAAIRPVVEDLRQSAELSPAALSKFQAGLLAAGISVPGPPDLGPSTVTSDATIGEVAYAVLRAQVRELLANEPGTRLGEDPEALHDMRVATRRLRAALDLFASALPSRAAAIRKELGWIADELGAVRDLDVQLADMAQRAGWAEHWIGPEGRTALGHLRMLLELERDEARGELLEALESARWERLTSALVAFARQGPSRRNPAARVPALLAAGALVESGHRAMWAAAKRARRSQSAHDLHRVRIRGKRLRYALEFLAPLYGKPALRFTKKLVVLQDLLGAVQDAEVGAARLFALATEQAPPGAALPPAAIFVMGGLAERYREESARLRAALPKRFRVLRAGAWQQLRTTLERAALDAAPAAGASAPVLSPRHHAGIRASADQSPKAGAPEPTAPSDGVEGDAVPT